MTRISLKVVANCDDTFLAWEPDGDIPNCLGFAIMRKRNNGEPEILKNRVGFTDGNGGEFTPQHSTDYPFQRLAWTDHAANTGDTVSYQVVAMVGTPGNLTQGPASEWSEPITLTPDCGNISAYFNRGIVLSQFVGHLMKEHNWSAADLKTHAAMVNDMLREFLSGDLRKALLDMLDEAAADTKMELYAALFELSDPELLMKMEFLGPRLHIVLANGAVKHKVDDENKNAREQLISAGAEVCDRFSAPSFLAHNKFVVACRNDEPVKVWTGSANWMPTGLCTQINNGVLIENAELAGDFKNAWDRLKSAQNSSPASLKSQNTLEPQVRDLGNGSKAFVRFTAVKDQIDLVELTQLIQAAQESIVFQMFMPGPQIFEAVTARLDDIFVRGVVNTFPNIKKSTDTVDVSLVDPAAKPKFRLDVVEPQGIDHPFSDWAHEVTRREFNAIGHAIIHSKVLVIDAFGEKPVVVTGSHNFSNTASKSNDENFVAIRGNKRLAEAFAVNCLAVYDHYRWRQYILDSEKSGKPHWSHLSSDPNWLAKYKTNTSRQALLKYVGLK